MTSAIDSTEGTHLLIELHGCPHTSLDSVEGIRDMMLTAAMEGGFDIVGELFHQFSPTGVSGVVVIAESHMSIHTWPELGYAAVDVYTCGGIDPHPAAVALARMLQADDMDCTEVRRGAGHHAVVRWEGIRSALVR